MKLLAFNGSPKKDWNTATLLQKALEGAASHGAETNLIHLYNLNFKGCVSCFACKLKAGKGYRNCAYKDDLTPILEEVEHADALIFGSPIYLGTATGIMKSFLERLIFPYLIYDTQYSTLFKKKIQTGFIYTMESRLRVVGYDQQFSTTEMLMAKIFGASESLFATDTYQFDDYSKYMSTSFSDEENVANRRKESPIDCKNSFQMGVRFAAAYRV
ncbi:MAG: NADPH-dependent reductase [Firmicutes bacterium]|nr:NADPH-dependent reductase [Bacillota bacterium]